MPRRYAELCLEVSSGDDVGPFYLGYAHEAAARAAAIAGDTAGMQSQPRRSCPYRRDAR